MKPQFLVTLRVDSDKLAELVMEFPDAVESVAQAASLVRLPIKRRKLTAEDKKRIGAMTAAGKAPEEIAREIGCAVITVQRHATPKVVTPIRK